MGAPATPEVQTQPEPVEPSPVVEPEVTPLPAEGEGTPEGEGTDRAELIRELLKDTTPDELKLLLAEAPEEARTELEQELERKGEAREKTRKREMANAKSSRLTAWQPYIDNLSAADGYVKGTVARLKTGDYSVDVNQLERAINDATLGHTGRVLVENESYVDGLIEEHLPELTAEEAKSLDKPLYEFARTGQAGKIIPHVFTLAVERAKAEGFAEGVKKGEANRQAKAALAEKLAKIAEIKQQAPGVPLNGRAESVSDRRSVLMQEINSFDPTKMPRVEAEARLAELRDKLRKLAV